MRERKKDENNTNNNKQTHTHRHDQQAHERIAFNARDKNACVKKNKSLVAARFAVLLTIFSPRLCLILLLLFQFTHISSPHSRAHQYTLFPMVFFLSRMVVMFSLSIFTVNLFTYEHCERISGFWRYLLRNSWRIFMKYWILSRLPIFASARHVCHVNNRICVVDFNQMHSTKLV